MIRVQGVHHVKVPVTDLTCSRSWYESVLPLTPQLEFADEEGTVRFYTQEHHAEQDISSPGHGSVVLPAHR